MQNQLSRIAKFLSELELSHPQNEEDWRSARIKFYESLCADYNVSFSWPLSLDTCHALVQKILDDKEPESARYLPVHEMSGSVLLGQLKGLIAKHFIPAPGKSSKKRGGRRSKFNEQLRAYALLAPEMSKYHWDAIPKAEQVLEQNHELQPQPQRSSLNPPAEALLSGLRKLRVDSKKAEKARQAALSSRLQEFVESLEGETKEWVIRLLQLNSEIPNRCDGQHEAKIAMINEWFALAKLVLPEPVLVEFLKPGMPVEQAYVITGLQLQAEALALKDESQSDDEHTGGNDARQYYRQPSN